MNGELVDLYSDYLLSSPIQAGGRLFGATTATGLSGLLEGSLSHDPITRFLSQQRFDSKTLWQLVKPMVRAIEDDAGVLIFDDTIEEKPYTDENELSSPGTSTIARTAPSKASICLTVSITPKAPSCPWPTNSSVNPSSTTMRKRAA